MIVGDPSAWAMEAAITRAQNHDELIAAITTTYQRQGPEGWAQRIAEALTLAELAAMLGVTEDYPRTETLEMNAKKSWWSIPKVFQRAVDWFTEKLDKAVEVPVVYEFGERPVKRAPDVASAAQLDAAARLRTRAEKGKQQEEPIATTKTELYGLMRDLGVDPTPVRSHPIVQEELQSRFARTRESILSLDFYRAAYPYWRYSSVLDRRTTLGCRALHGLTMPASDPRWVGYVPPRHWKCRAHVLAVVHSEGVNARKTEPSPEYAGDGSFGTLTDEWEPKPGSYPTDLWEIYAAAKGIANPHIELEGRWWRENPD